MTPNPDVMEKAKALISAVKNALAAGTQHYDRSGQLLETPEQVLRCLQEEGSVTCVAGLPQERGAT
jgi:hypothetical protein